MKLLKKRVHKSIQIETTLVPKAQECKNKQNLYSSTYYFYRQTSTSNGVVHGGMFYDAVELYEPTKS